MRSSQLLLISLPGWVWGYLSPAPLSVRPHPVPPSDRKLPSSRPAAAAAGPSSHAQRCGPLFRYGVCSVYSDLRLVRVLSSFVDFKWMLSQGSQLHTCSHAHMKQVVCAVCHFVGNKRPPLLETADNNNNNKHYWKQCGVLLLLDPSGVPVSAPTVLSPTELLLWSGASCFSCLSYNTQYSSSLPM